MIPDVSFYTKMIEYRKQIDQQDQIILNALEKRFKIVQEVSEVKNKNRKSDIDLFFNMKREHSLVKDLINKNILPPKLVFSVWRNFISLANESEQSIEFFCDSHEAQIELCKNYPAFCGLAKEYDINSILNPQQPIVAILKLNKNSSWWYDIFIVNAPIQNNLYIFNLLPSFKNHNSSDDVFVALGYINQEALENDYKIYIVPTKSLKSDIILSQYEEMSLIITKNIISNGKLVGLVGEKVYDK